MLISDVAIRRPVFTAMIMSALVVFGWVFFRANSLGDALTLVGSMLCQWETFDVRTLGNPYELLVTFGAIGFMEFVHLCERTGSMTEFLLKSSRPIRWGFYYVLIIGILVFGQFTEQEFIYFQF